MKLTNLSLSILVALGLIACGGSDDNSNAAADNNNAGHQQGGKGGSGGVPEEKKPEQTNEDKKNEQTSGIDPTRAAPDLKVPADLLGLVNSRKKSFIDRSFSDSALGYDTDGKTYNPKWGTDPEDVKLNSLYNFANQDDLIATPTGAYSGNADATDAIFVGDNPNSPDLNAWAKGADNKYYRVKAKAGAAAYKPSTKFETVLPAANALNGYGSGSDDISQSKVVFIANAKDHVNGVDPTDVLELGNVADFKLEKSEVVLNTVSALGHNYIASGTGQELDFSKMDVKPEIQQVPVTGQFSILNTKGNTKSVDDKGIIKDIKLGHIKAYNLPYSIAYVTVDESSKNGKNIFALKAHTGFVDPKSGLVAAPVTGEYQVNGLQTVSLPKQGRAFYTGKSFNATRVGDVKLIADFFDDRAGVTGSVLNRKDLAKGKSLPEVTLNRIELTDIGNGHRTQGNAAATGDNKITQWSVQFYGLDAQEASGYLSGKNYTEVFATQRDVLTSKSNDAGTK